MYKELILFPEKFKSERIYPEMSRKIISDACAGHSISPAIFRRMENGKTINTRIGDDREGEGFATPPEIIFDGGLGFIRLYGIGQSGCALLDDQTPLIVSAVAKYVSGSYRMDMKHGDCTLEMSEPTLYSIRRLVMAKSPDAMRHFVNVPAINRQSEIALVLKRGIFAMAKHLDGEPDSTSFLENLIPADDIWDIEILEGEPALMMMGNGIHVAGYKNVTFSTTLKLNGPWTAGKLQSKGYGLIRRRIER